MGTARGSAKGTAKGTAGGGGGETARGTATARITPSWAAARHITRIEDTMQTQSKLQYKVEWDDGSVTWCDEKNLPDQENFTKLHEVFEAEMKRSADENGAYKVLAGKYVPEGIQLADRRHRYRYQLWWLNKTVTWEPLWVVNDLDKRFQDDLHKYPGVKRKFTGSRGGWVRPSTLEPFPTVVVNDTLVAEVQAVKLINQKTGKLCALNSVANVVRLPQALYEELIKDDPPLEQVTHLINAAGVAQFRKPKDAAGKGIENTDLLDWMRCQDTGVFAVEYDGHCVTWDAAKQTILDTDPLFPNALPINEDTLTRLKIKCVEKAYEIFPGKEKKGKERKGKERKRKEKKGKEGKRKERRLT